MILTLAAAIVTMGVSDFLGTVLVVAESHGRDRLAGLMDAGGDISRLLCTLVGVDALQRGVNARSLAVLAAICGTSYVVTRRTTKWARRFSTTTKETAA